MRAGKVDPVKRRLLQQAIAENLETMRGKPPRAVRTRYRLTRLWLKRAPAVLIPLTLAGSTYLASNPPSAADTVRPAQIIIQSSARRPLVVKPGSLEPAAGLPRIDPAALSLSVRRVVVDAGHGGTDPGAMSPSKVMEKEITLDIARRLETLLRRNGFEVVATRAEDRLIPLRERARVANENEGDIFVSIHVNSIKNPAFHGVETYYLGATNDPSLTRLAAAENAASGYSLTDMRKLLDGVYADARRDESHRLAGVVQQELFAGLRNIDPGLQNWGVKRAPFVVLVATDMPAVLAEVGCISNENEAAMLHRPEYREQIANALFRGIREYAGKEKG
jgi:N-acetylmuramoyl-L-alanine amidase